MLNPKCFLQAKSLNKFLLIDKANFTDQISSKYIEKTRTNTIINICKQNEDIVIERLGKFNRLQKSGVYIAFPIIDKIRYVFDNRELTIPIEPLQLRHFLRISI